MSSSIDTWVNLFGDTDTPSDSHMEFTETYLGEQMRVSPDGKMVCSICECEIRSRLTLTIQGSGCGTVVARYPLGRFNRRSEIGGNVKWSPDSTRILVGGMGMFLNFFTVFTPIFFHFLWCGLNQQITNYLQKFTSSLKIG